jgi:hypothetical protein
MRTRQIALIAMVAVFAVLMIVAIAKPELGEHTVHGLHVAAWVLGLVDALLVGVSFLAQEAH